MAVCVSSAPRKCTWTPGAISRYTLSREPEEVGEELDSLSVGLDGAVILCIWLWLVLPEMVELGELVRVEMFRRSEGGRSDSADREEDKFLLHEAWDDVEGIRCVDGRVTSGDTMDGASVVSGRGAVEFPLTV